MEEERREARESRSRGGKGSETGGFIQQPSCTRLHRDLRLNINYVRPRPVRGEALRHVLRGLAEPDF